jgi:hypothetical protein
VFGPRAKVRYFTIVLIAGSLAACVAPSVERLTANGDYRLIIAQSLDYKDDRIAPGRYEISDPWVALTGEIMVCLATHPPNGKGGYFPAAEYSLHAIEKGQVSSIVRPYPDCHINATFKPLEPINRK